MEKAYRRLAEERAPAAIQKLDAWTLTHTYPLSREQLSVAYVWQPPGSDDYTVAAKGAPEAIADLCVLDAIARAAIRAQVAEMAREGLRVLAVARGSLARAVPGADSWPASQAGLQLSFVGLTGLADPIRPAVPAAARQCYEAGIRTVMITGDYPGTAQAIARQAGLANPETMLSGPELEEMSDDALSERVKRVNIFARVTPDQKLRLVKAFKANGEIVAMTGDGVNDAPALKAAHIGVAMGQRGSDVAREAASLVLLEDDFASLVEAVKLGRRIFDNIQNAMCYIIAVHVPTAGMALIPLLFGWPLVFYPVHIVCLEFVIDPACSVAFEAELPANDVMRRPPRSATSRLFDGGMIVASIMQGTSVLIAVVALYGIALSSGVLDGQARAMAFAAIVLGNIGLILVNRSRGGGLLETLARPNPVLWWIVGGAILGLVLALYVGPLQKIFQFAPLDGHQLLMCIAAVALGLACPEAYWRLRPHTHRR